MISVEAARERIVGRMHPTGAESVGLSQAWSRVLAEDVVARLTQPPADMSAMDGYAVGPCAGAVGDTLRLVGAVAAGHPFEGTVGPGEAVRIFTGAVLPPGAVSILLQEDATATPDQVRIGEALVPGRHIRRAGQDFQHGARLLAAGRRLGAREIGLAAAANHAWLSVHRRPVVAILASGDEIFMPGDAIPPGGIVSSNSHALAAMVRAAGGHPVMLPIVRDDAGAIADAVAGAGRFDLLVTSGGASVGDHDLVRPGMERGGFELDFWRIAMRPGKPLMFGRLADTPVLGLPGNPVSALVCAILFLLPAIGRLCGLAGEAPATLPALLAAALPANDHRADFLRCALATDAEGVLTARAFTSQDSAQLRLLAEADGLILRAPHAPAAGSGDVVQVLRLADLGV